MTLRLIHTSDWQIGKVFQFVDNATMGLLQEARLRAITRLGELARGKDVHHILVAGDVYDMEVPRSLNQPLERMRNFAGVHWHLMPGNHDHYRPNALESEVDTERPSDHLYVLGATLRGTWRQAVVIATRKQRRAGVGMNWAGAL